MKRFLLIAAFILGLLLLTNPVWSDDYFIGSINVGSLDTFLTSTKLENSSPKTEASWIAEYLKLPSVEITKIDANPWQPTNTTGIYAWDFGNLEPGYFYIKTGNVAQGNSGVTPDHWLFKNIGDLNWGVIELQGKGYDIVNIGKVSHVGFTSVPEPATLALLGFGLIGVGWTARRGRKKQPAPKE